MRMEERKESTSISWMDDINLVKQSTMLMYLNTLKIERTHPNDAGVWAVNGERLHAALGLPDPREYPDVRIVPGQPMPDGPELGYSINSHRSEFYLRLTSTAEAKQFLDKRTIPLRASPAIGISLRIGSEWLSDPLGNISTFDPAAISDSHHVILTDYVSEKQAFRFQNSWGGDWGDHGYGTLTAEYIEKRAFELWVTYVHAAEESFRPTILNHDDWIQVLTARDWERNPVKIFRITDKARCERKGWLTLRRRGKTVSIEDLYVLPRYRGMRLANMLIDFAQKDRFWGDRVYALVPFADCPEIAPWNSAALEKTVARLGLGFSKSPSRHAAYLIEPKSKRTSAFPIGKRIPERPRSEGLAPVVEAVAKLVLSGSSFLLMLHFLGYKAPIKEFLQKLGEFIDVAVNRLRLQNEEKAQVLKQQRDQIEFILDQAKKPTREAPVTSDQRDDYVNGLQTALALLSRPVTKEGERVRDQIKELIKLAKTCDPVSPKPNINDAGSVTQISQRL